MLQYLGKHSLKVVEAREHESPADIVKRLVKHPHLLTVLAHKRQVERQRLAGLDQADVGANDLRLGVLFGELLGPYARAGPYVEDVGRLADGGHV